MHTVCALLQSKLPIGSSAGSPASLALTTAVHLLFRLQVCTKVRYAVQGLARSICMGAKLQACYKSIRTSALPDLLARMCQHATRARREATSSARTHHGEVRVQARDGQNLSVTVVNRRDRCSLVLPVLRDSRFLTVLNGCVESTKGREQPVGGGLPLCASKGNGLVCCAA